MKGPITADTILDIMDGIDVGDEASAAALVEVARRADAFEELLNMLNACWDHFNEDTPPFGLHDVITKYAAPSTKDKV